MPTTYQITPANAEGFSPLVLGLADPGIPPFCPPAPDTRLCLYGLHSSPSTPNQVKREVLSCLYDLHNSTDRLQEGDRFECPEGTWGWRGTYVPAFSLSVSSVHVLLDTH